MPVTTARRFDYRRRHFVHEYLRDLNATKAAIRAGYPAKTAHVNGPRMLANDGVGRQIAIAQAQQIKRLDLQADRVLNETAEIAFYDPISIVDDEGDILPLHRMPEHGRRIISHYKQRECHDKDGNVIGHVKEVWFCDKVAALTSLMKHFKLLEPLLDAERPVQIVICDAPPPGMRIISDQTQQGETTQPAASTYPDVVVE